MSHVVKKNGASLWVAPAWAMMALLACDDGSSAKKGPCERGDIEGCGKLCNATTACETGLYCGASAKCTAECTASSAASDCATNQACSGDGRCVASSDGGEDGDKTSGSSAGDNGSGNVCADVSLKASTTTPNVIVVVDQSGSMTAKFGSGTRWSVLKDALLSDTGLIAELQGVVRFGVALYTYDEAKDKTCPIITPGTLSVALNALGGIRSVYMPAEPGDNTPTGESIEAVLAQVKTIGLLGPDVTDPTIFILATDGNPDTCALPDQGSFGSANSQVATKRSVDAVKKAHGDGVRTFVIAVADENDLAQTHVNDLANAGVGDKAAPGVKSAPSYRVNDDKGLRDALRTIISGELSCNVKLNGKIVGDACEGTVKLDGATLPCNADNGWKLVDPSTIEVLGTACDALKQGKPLTATFPCDSVMVL